MSFTPLQNLQLHHQIDRVLNVPGNYRGGILEMAIVIDCSFSLDAIRALCRDISTALKKHSEVFRNVRLNLVCFSEKGIRSEVISLALLQTGSYFDSYEQDTKRQKRLEELMDYLKRFQARSKLVLFLTEDEHISETVTDREKMIQFMNPFLKQKLILIYPERMENGNDFIRRLILQTT